MMKYKILPQEVLKLLACVTMFIDHFGCVIVQQLPLPYAKELYYLCRAIGRVAFPIYAFLLVEGMRRTRNPKKYILRLAIGILLAELPFDYLFDGFINWQYQSVMVTLTLGAIMLLCMQKTQKVWVKLLTAVAFGVLAKLTQCDYGAWGIAMITVFALLDRTLFQTLGLFLVNVLDNHMAVPVFGIWFPLQSLAVLAMVPIALYSGKKLTSSKAVQWAFYLFYPVHMLILWGIQAIIL